MKIAILKTRGFQLCSAFTLGVVVGYGLGLSRFGLRTYDRFLDRFDDLLLGIYRFVPPRDFLSDVAAFEAVVIGLAIPLSFEIVSRISERYKSEVITKRFIHEWSTRWLQILLIANITLAVCIKFFVHEDPTSDIWKIVSWITFVGFIVTIIVFVHFLRRLSHYATDADSVLNELFDHAEEFLK
jgi:hypothetical protein